MVGIHNTLQAGQSILQQRQGQKQGRKRKHFLRLLFWLTFLLALAPMLTLAGYVTVAQQYQRDKMLGDAAEQHLQAALKLFTSWSKEPFNLTPVQEAGQEFRVSQTIIAQVTQDLRILPGLVGQVPVAGTRLVAAENLLEAAQGVSQAGAAGCQLLEAVLPGMANPLSAHGQGLTMAEVGMIDRLFPLIRAGIAQTLESASHLQASDLSFNPHLAQTFASFQHDLPLASALLADVTGLLPALPSLLGVNQSANYLLEILDSSELRPGGGFIGNDGLLTLTHGRFEGAHIQDVLLLDKQVKDGEQYIPWPSAYVWLSNYLNVPSWSLRDSNLDADFPTDARNAEENYDLEGGQGLVQGVIAVTPALIQHALEITGPLAMPEYHETVTADNLIDLIHYHQLGAGSEGNSSQLTADGQTSLRKHFTELLAEHFMARLHHFSAADLGRFVGLFAGSLQSKDIQVYLNDPAAEDLLQRFHIASNIQAPASDSLFVVDANSAGNKANAFIHTTFQDQVTLDRAGDALHHLTLSYAWTTPGNIYGTGFYRDYMRVYVPPGSTFVQEQGLQTPGTGSAFGRTFWLGSFRMHYGQTAVVRLVWMVPHVARQTASGSGWQYEYLVQHQAGTHWVGGVQMSPGMCSLTGVSGAGQQIKSVQQAVWGQALNKDLTLGIQYSCASL